MWQGKELGASRPDEVEEGRNPIRVGTPAVLYRCENKEFAEYAFCKPMKTKSKRNRNVTTFRRAAFRSGLLLVAGFLAEKQREQ